MISMKKLLSASLFFSLFLILNSCESRNNDFKDENNHSLFILDNGIHRNNKFIEKNSNFIIEAMAYTTDYKVQYKPIVLAAKNALSINDLFIEYINEMRDQLILDSGGSYTLEEAVAKGRPELSGKPKGENDRKTPQAIFISEASGKEAQGPVLEKKILDLKKEYLDRISALWDNDGFRGTIFSDLAKKEAMMKELEEQLTLSSSENYDSQLNDGKTWSEYTFGNSSVADVYTMLRQYQNDAINSEATVIHFLAEQIGRLRVNYNQFDVLSNSAKPSVVLGETYQAEIALGAFSSMADFSVNVNGANLKVVDGKAMYSARPSSTGEKTYTATISVRNPLTRETSSFKKEFYYEVVQPCQ